MSSSADGAIVAALQALPVDVVLVDEAPVEEPAGEVDASVDAPFAAPLDEVRVPEALVEPLAPEALDEAYVSEALAEPRASEVSIDAPVADAGGADEIAPASVTEPADESSNRALTVALLVPDVTPVPEIEPTAAVDAAEQAPPEIIETMEPDAVSFADGSGVAGAPRLDVQPEPEVAAAEEHADGSSDVRSDVPVPVNDGAAALDASAPKPNSAAERRGLDVSRPSSDRPPSPGDGRPSAPVVVDVFADSVAGLTDAIARAAEAAHARDERHEHRAPGSPAAPFSRRHDHRRLPRRRAADRAPVARGVGGAPRSRHLLPRPAGR